MSMEWISEGALCAEVDLDMFFPAKGEHATAAKRICQRCDVRMECLEYALAQPGLDGVWGGTSDFERKRIRVEREIGEGAAA